MLGGVQVCECAEILAVVRIVLYNSKQAYDGKRGIAAVEGDSGIKSAAEMKMGTKKSGDFPVQVPKVKVRDSGFLVLFSETGLGLRQFLFRSLQCLLPIRCPGKTHLQQTQNTKQDKQFSPKMLHNAPFSLKSIS